ncbi:MAG: glycosyltransferase family 2 protein [Fusobacterium perfoetens]|uniref:glycosyltransferase family 2 protein n=1 Tax=Fusobacterium perfoetens TaxID=852 RepID=UPI0023EF807C|nr:glycosyltransferase family 2 protein [Fusobacterium perfoetens]MCI6152539.1 glycosyltransferase family 2 protein [Fusobacterium perfoetens]MDY3237548.1 glycosyltransferase family 2 protein [Fusobacterium perfoetens]
MERISVVAPVYNEKDNVSRFIEKVENSLKKGFDSYEIILVNDGSTDGSKEILNEEAKKNGHVKVFHFTKNNGQTAALDFAFKKASGDLVLMMDSDLQTDPEDVYTLLPYIKEYDMVNGKRETREDGLKRKISSVVGNSVRNYITGDDIKDTGCPLKLFKKEVVKSFYLYEGMHRFLPTLAKINGFKVVEIPVKHYDREFGYSKYGVFNRLFKGLKDAFAVRWMKKRRLRYQVEMGEDKNV